MAVICYRLSVSGKRGQGAATEWKANQRITVGTYEWGDRHVLAVSTPAEIPSFWT
jgi:hypothetical protein